MILPAIGLVTVKLFKVPTLVKLGNVVSVELLVAVIFPAVVAFVAVAALPVILPTIGLVTVKFSKVPTLVKLELVTVDFKIVPVKVLAFTVVLIAVDKEEGVT